MTVLSFAVARLWTDTRSNAVDPGWVPTRMGGRGAPDNLVEGYATQVALATSSEPRFASPTGHYLRHTTVREPDEHVRDASLQVSLLKLCRELSGVTLSASA